MNDALYGQCPRCHRALTSGHVCSNNTADQPMSLDDATNEKIKEIVDQAVARPKPLLGVPMTPNEKMLDDTGRCLHVQHMISADITFIEDAKRYLAEISIHCKHCGEQFRFLDQPIGANLNGIATDVDAFKVRLAILPANQTLHPLELFTRLQITEPDAQLLRRIAERGLKHAQTTIEEGKRPVREVDTWQHMLDEITRIIKRSNDG